MYILARTAQTVPGAVTLPGNYVASRDMQRATARYCTTSCVVVVNGSSNQITCFASIDLQVYSTDHSKLYPNTKHLLYYIICLLLSATLLTLCRGVRGHWSSSRSA